mgnify:CR=1 FL=1
MSIAEFIEKNPTITKGKLKFKLEKSNEILSLYDGENCIFTYSNDFNLFSYQEQNQIITDGNIIIYLGE